MSEIVVNCQDINIYVPIIGIVCTAFISWRVYRNKLSDANYGFSLDGERKLQDAYKKFHNFFYKDVFQNDNWDKDLYDNAIQVGEEYLLELKNLCFTILAHKIHRRQLKEHLDKISFKNIILYYKAIGKIAKAIGIKPQELRLRSYSNVQKVHNIYLRKDNRKYCFKLGFLFRVY